MHARGTVEVIEKRPGDALAIALAHDAMSEKRVTPWYRSTVDFDRTRTAPINVVIQGWNTTRRDIRRAQEVPPSPTREELLDVLA